MVVRIAKKHIVATALVTVSLLMGAALVPVAAQQSGLDGQVAVRSDGSVYLITGGQRRWVATVQITDAELNAYPEAEPIYAGLAPLGPSAAVSASPAASPAMTAQRPVTSAVPPAAPGVSAGTVDPSLPVEIDIDGAEKFEAGDVIRLEVKTSVGASCDLSVRFPDGSEVARPGTAADERGHCAFSVDIPSTSPVGAGLLLGTARLNGRTSVGEHEFEVVPNQ